MNKAKTIETINEVTQSLFNRLEYLIPVKNPKLVILFDETGELFVPVTLDSDAFIINAGFIYNKIINNFYGNNIENATDLDNNTIVILYIARQILHAIHLSYMNMIFNYKQYYRYKESEKTQYIITELLGLCTLYYTDDHLSIDCNKSDILNVYRLKEKYDCLDDFHETIADIADYTNLISDNFEIDPKSLAEDVFDDLLCEIDIAIDLDCIYLINLLFKIIFKFTDTEILKIKDVDTIITFLSKISTNKDFVDKNDPMRDAYCSRQANRGSIKVHISAISYSELDLLQPVTALFIPGVIVFFVKILPKLKNVTFNKTEIREGCEGITLHLYFSKLEDNIILG